MPVTESIQRESTAYLLKTFVSLEILQLMGRTARYLGLSKVPPTLTEADLALPDSKLVTDALDAATTLYRPALLHHVLRTWCFGIMLSVDKNLKPDRELFALAALFHDFGLEPKHDGDESFEVEGARAAHRWLLERKVPRDRADLVHEAIALHTMVGKADKKEPEIALVHLGAGVDVIGLNLHRLDRQSTLQILERYPRDDFVPSFSSLLTDQVERKPQCCIAGHMKLGFLNKVAANPLEIY